MAGHMLGPHVVGQRVVLRRRLPDGSATDLLGQCLGWGEAGCVVQPAAGPPITIPLAEIITGKPVPPRPSVRGRVAPRDAQLHGFALFPDLVTRPLGQWVLRDSPTATARRANSVLAFGPSGVADDVATVLAHYERPIAAVLAGSDEERRLLELGWVPESTEADTLFLVTATAQLSRALRQSPNPVVEVRGPLGPSLETPQPPVVEVRGPLGPSLETPQPPPVVEVRGPLGPSLETPQLVTATIADHASGVAAYADDWLGLRAIEVAPTHRRRGLARAIIAALVEWGAEQGARTTYLQVLADNAPAVALYERLGFRTHHTYRYLTPPTT